MNRTVVYVGARSAPGDGWRDPAANSQVVRTCVHCGREFRTASRVAITCSEACRAERKRQMESKAARKRAR